MFWNRPEEGLDGLVEGKVFRFSPLVVLQMNKVRSLLHKPLSKRKMIARASIVKRSPTVNGLELVPVVQQRGSLLHKPLSNSKMTVPASPVKWSHPVIGLELLLVVQQ